MTMQRPALGPRIARAVRSRWRTLETVAALIAARTLVRFLPFSWWRGMLGTIGSASDVAVPPTPRKTDAEMIHLVARDIARWSRRLPFSVVCLPRAMAARWILLRRGIDGRIVIGARTGQALNPIDLHAWLMIGDICVTGDAERQSFEAFVRRPRKSA